LSHIPLDPDTPQGMLYEQLKAMRPETLILNRNNPDLCEEFDCPFEQRRVLAMIDAVLESKKNQAAERHENFFFYQVLGTNLAAVIAIGALIWNIYYQRRQERRALQREASVAARRPDDDGNPPAS
jgi:hypothetical protein